MMLACVPCPIVTRLAVHALPRVFVAGSIGGYLRVMTMVAFKRGLERATTMVGSGFPRYPAVPSNKLMVSMRKMPPMVPIRVIRRTDRVQEQAVIPLTAQTHLMVRTPPMGQIRPMAQTQRTLLARTERTLLARTHRMLPIL
jgi:hypothetical protein